MATGVVISVAEKLFSVLTSHEVKEICSMFGYESQLDELALTVSTIKAVLLDAELKQQELTHGGQEYIERLKDAVYDDDVLDEFNTMVQKEKRKNGGKTFKKVRRFFSRSNEFLVAYSMSYEIKKIRDKLDSIAKHRQQFGFSDVFEPPTKRKETGSYAREDAIIGRKAETEAIVSLLLGEPDHQSDVRENITFVTIVGMGGLGKTALAQLVYNDEKIKDAFELRLWVCVSNEFGLEHIFAKMIGKNVDLGMEELQREVRNMIEKRKYLLVLDDVWDENHNKWVELKDFLLLGGSGSRVVTTTRSKAVSEAIEDNHMYVLKGLSNEHSWCLFERMAFEQGKAPLDHDLVDIGKDVVKKCANVPLSIRVVGSLLYGQHKSKWLSFKSIDLRKLVGSKDGQAEDGIMPILKYSYYLLSPSLKSCFSYCALFPKDFIVTRIDLIWLWMAHGCLDVSNDGRTVEGLGNDYFSILVNRCFFQAVTQGTDGKIHSFAVHDLIHDLALEVAGKESLALETSVFQFDRKLRHLGIGNDGCKLLTNPSSCLGEMKKLRSLHHNHNPFSCSTANESNVNTIGSNLRRLRLLDLSNFNLRFLPNSFCNLLHLRYLDLSFNRQLEIIPKSITKLQNLLVLNLSNSGVRELPKGLRNLHNLRHLGLANCFELTHMPVGMDSMVNLRTLSMFVMARESSKQVKTGQLIDLRSLVHLEGRLEIVFRHGFSYNLANAMKVDCVLSNKMHLHKLVICWEQNAFTEHSQIDEMLLEGLRPHCNIKGIEIKGYKGVRISSWVSSLAVFFPCLVEVTLRGLDWLYNLPSLSQLLNLKALRLSSLPNIEFIDCNGDDPNHDLISTASDSVPFFPSLEKLVLRNLPRLKGVRNDVIPKIEAIQSFPRLHDLDIGDCPRLTRLPKCPCLKTLWLVRVNENFRFEGINDDSTIYLRNLDTDNMGLVNLMFGESLRGIDSLYVQGFRLEALSEATDVFQRHASSLRRLYLHRGNELKSLCGGGIEHLTNLTHLSIKDFSVLDLGDGDDCGMSPWKSLVNLRQLIIWSLSNLIYLPQGFQHLSSLRYLHICNSNLESLPEWLPKLASLTLLWLQTCTELKSLPEAISHVPALREVRVWDCKHLTDRCRETDGQDWPKISHIPVLDIRPHID